MCKCLVYAHFEHPLLLTAQFLLRILFRFSSRLNVIHTKHFNYITPKNFTARVKWNNTDPPSHSDKRQTHTVEPLLKHHNENRVKVAKRDGEGLIYIRGPVWHSGMALGW